MAQGSPVHLEPLPNFSDLPPFAESAPTFAENAAGKALHYSHYTPEILLADDSGLVVPALGGRPGVHSARYAGPGATDGDRYRKLLREMAGKKGGERIARFVCVVALARRGRALAVVSDRAEGMLAAEPRGSSGFGYDPIFFFPPLGRTFAEVSSSEKSAYSHRGKAFRKALEYLGNSSAAL
jgi:XTP/dITP diphosphohydrolase